MKRFYVCGIGYDENNRVTDNEWHFGSFNDYAKAYEHFVKLQCRNAASFFKDTNSNVYNVYQLLIQLEECEENEDGVECIDVRNEFWVKNPNYNTSVTVTNYSGDDEYSVKEYGKNASGIVSKMVSLAGRFCEHHASDIINDANAFIRAVDNNEVFNEILFFRDGGVAALTEEQLEYIEKFDYIQSWQLRSDPETRKQTFTRVNVKFKKN